MHNFVENDSLHIHQPQISNHVHIIVVCEISNHVYIIVVFVSLLQRTGTWPVSDFFSCTGRVLKPLYIWIDACLDHIPN